MLRSLRGLRPAQVLVVAVAALLPIVHSMLLLRSFRTPQFALLIVAIGCMSGALFNGSFEWLRREAMAVRLSVAFFAAAVTWMTISTLVGVDPVRSLMGHQFQTTGLLLWIAALGLYVLALRHRFVIADRVEGATLFAWIVLFLFVAMWLVARDLVQEFLVPLNRGSGVPLPGIGQSAFLASFAGAGLLLTSGRWIRAPRRFGLLAMAALLAAYLVVTGARVPIVMTALSLGVGLAVVRRRGANPMIIGLLALVVIAPGIAAQMALVPRLTVPGAPLVDRVEESVAPDRDLRGRFAPTAVASGVQFRATVWGVAARTALRRPLFGNGPANFTYSYRQLSTETDVEQLGEPDTEIQDAHNIFIEVAATSGLPAAFLLLAGMVTWGWSVTTKQVPPRPDGLTWLRLGALGFLGVLLVEPLSLVVIPLMAIFAGIGAGGTQSSATLWRPWSVARGIPAGAAALASVLIAVSFVWSDRLLASGSVNWDRRTLAAAAKLDPTCQQCLYQLGKVRSWDFKKEGKGTEAWALEPFERAIDRHPGDSEAHLRFGGGLLFLDREALAIAPFVEARRLNPHSASAAGALATAYLRAGQPEEALEAAKDAVKIQPSAAAYRVIAEAAGQLGLTVLRDDALAEAKRLGPNRS